MRTIVALLLSLAPLMGACESSVEPSAEPRVPGAERIDPLPQYASWYEDMQGCVGRAGDFASIRWFMVPGTRSTYESPSNGQRVAGEWYPPHDIYLPEPRLTDWASVNHEMIHDLLQSAEHPSPPFDHCAPLYLFPDLP